MTQQPPPDIVPDGVHLRAPEDFTTARKQIYDGVLDETRKAFPQSFGGVRLEAQDLDYADPEDFDLHAQKDALLNGKFMGRRIRGTVRLFDEKTNQQLDERAMTLMRVPHLTERGTFLHGGNEYTSMSQFRLRPGPYTRRKANGELETHFNIARGTGSGFRVRFEPKSMLYKLDVGQSQLRLYSLLHDVGVPDEEMQKAWGADVFQANKNAYDARVLDKAHARLVKKPDPNASREQKISAIRSAFEGMQIHRGIAQKNLPNMFDREKAAQWKAAGSTSMDLPPPTDAPAPIHFSVKKTAQFSLIKVATPAELYDALRAPETAGLRNPWVKNASSSAYGPVQLTALLARDYAARFPQLFDSQELDYLKNYGVKQSSTQPNTLTQNLYRRVAEKIIDHTFTKRAGGDTTKFIQLWRGVPEEQDPNYYRAVRGELSAIKQANSPSPASYVFLKLAKAGAIVFLPTEDGKYLLQRNPSDHHRSPGKLRPPGGGAEKEDANSYDTIRRELREEFGLRPDELSKLRYLGKDPRSEFGAAVFVLKDHGLTTGRYQASNDPEEVIDLEEVKLDNPDYVGPPASMLADNKDTE
jgi:8-oxo-dGTP pyrophosphatase MutT (NUDIX family)